MKRSAVLYSLLLVLILCCGRTGPASSFAVSVPLIPDGEECRYQILVAESPTGTFTLVSRHSMFREVPAYRFDLVARTKEGAVETVDSSVVYATPDSLRPITTFRFIRSSGALITTAANYADSSVAVSTYAQGLEKQQLLQAGTGTYDADELIPLGRALKVRGRKQVDLAFVSSVGPPMGGVVIRGSVSAGGEETVRVPAGSFECYKLLFKLGQQSVAVWYEKADAHRMVKYVAAEAEQTMELTASSQ